MRVLFIIIPLILLLGFGGWCGIASYLAYDNENTKKYIWQIVISSILALISLGVLIIVPGSIHQVEAGQVAVVKVWGEAKEVGTAGLHFDLWISHKYEIYDTKVQQVTVTTPAYSNDGQTMDIELVVQYQIQEDKAMEIAKRYGGLEMLESRIETISIERMKSVLSQQSAMEIIETRGQVSANVTQTISDAITDDYYINVSNVVLTNIDFSDAFEATIEQKEIAKQEKLKAEYDAQKAVVEAEAQLEKAKLEADAILYKAQQDAEATEVKAQAEADALKLLEESWNGMSSDVKEAILKKLAIENWNGDLPSTMVGSDFIEYLLGAIGN